MRITTKQDKLTLYKNIEKSASKMLADKELFTKTRSLTTRARVEKKHRMFLKKQIKKIFQASVKCEGETLQEILDLTDRCRVEVSKFAIELRKQMPYFKAMIMQRMRDQVAEQGDNIPEEDLEQATDDLCTEILKRAQEIAKPNETAKDVVERMLNNMVIKIEKRDMPDTQADTKPKRGFSEN